MPTMPGILFLREAHNFTFPSYLTATGRHLVSGFGCIAAQKPTSRTFTRRFRVVAVS